MNKPDLGLNLTAPPMMALLLAQFLSALADNALLIAAIALMKIMGHVNQISWVQTGFVLPFIVLAPFVGKIADRLPKGRVMLIGNTIKLGGTALMVAGLNPIAAYLIAGIGAAVYSPAKYGILSEFFNVEKLVKANALLEGSTIAAILLGVVAGGQLADQSVKLALEVIVAIYAAATVANLFIPHINPQISENQKLLSLELINHYWQAIRVLLRDHAARLSLIGTSLFWGSGAALRLMLFTWVPFALKIKDNHTPANLMGVLSVGIVIGSALAWHYIKLGTVRRALWGGLLIGPIIMALAIQTNLTSAIILLGLLGMCGGIFVVPLNALLQHRGQQSVGTGSALSIQNLAENLAMLIMVSIYGLNASLPVVEIITGFGSFMFLSVILLAWITRQK